MREGQDTDSTRQTPLSSDPRFQECCRASLQSLSTVKLALPESLERRILMQSIEGHAREGHVGFGDSAGFPDATIHDVVEALGEDPQEVLDFTQREIERWEEYFFEAVDALHANRDLLRKGGGGRIYPVARQQRALFGALESPKVKKFTPHQVEQYLAGVYLGSVMDSWKWRLRAEEKFQTLPEMHKGTVQAVHLPALARHDLTVRDLKGPEYRWALGLEDAGPREIIEALQDRGIVVEGTFVPTTRDVQAQYIQFTKGCGTSDDTALLFAGLIRGVPAFLGGGAIDQVDTLEKFTAKTVNGGYDEHIGKQLRAYYEYRMERPFPVTDGEALALIRVAAKEPSYHGKISSSQRYFHQEDAEGNSAMRQHAQWLQGIRGLGPKPGGRMKMGFYRIPANRFYHTVTQSLLGALAEDVISDPHGRLNGGRRSVGLYEPVLHVNPAA